MEAEPFQILTLLRESQAAHDRAACALMRAAGQHLRVAARIETRISRANASRPTTRKARSR